MILLALLLAAAVPNGDFDKNIKGWNLINNSGTALVAHDRATKSLRFSKTGAGGMDLVRCDLKSIPAPGSEFRLIARFRAKDVRNGWFKIFFYDAAGQSLGQGRDVKALRGTYKWKEIALDQQVPVGATSGAIMILLVMPGELGIDSVRLVLKDSAPAVRKPLNDPKLKKWLDRNAVPVRTLDRNGSLKDLGAFDKHLRGVRVVQLGENSHGDGLAFQAKVRLIRYLHEKHGFDVVAFESGLYECDRATSQIRPGADAGAIMRASIFPIWHTKRTRPLFEYMIEQSATRRPMALTGFDLQETGEGAKGLVPEAQSMLDGVDDEDPAKLLAAIRTRRTVLVKKHGERNVAFVERALDMRVQLKTYESLKGNERLNFRDRWMADNLAWLADVRYKGAKIVCWAATAHQAHGLDSVRNAKGPMYRGLTMAGVHARKHFGSRLFTIGFIAHGGWAGAWHRQNFRIAPPAENSVEALLHRYGKSPLLVPLKRSPFRWPLRMAPMSYGRDIEANWSRVLDAVFYLDEMEPAQKMTSD